MIVMSYVLDFIIIIIPKLSVQVWTMLLRLDPSTRELKL